MRLSGLNAIACMCQTICDAASSNILGRLVLREQKRVGWVGATKG